MLTKRSDGDLVSGPRNMPNRPHHYRVVKDYVYQGHVIEGLKRRPDERFYAAAVPSKTFGTKPREAILRFFRWQAKVAAGTITAPGFDFWRAAFHRLILDQPQIAAEVLQVPEIAELIKYDDETFDQVDDWRRIILPGQHKRLDE